MRCRMTEKEKYKRLRSRRNDKRDRAWRLLCPMFMWYMESGSDIIRFISQDFGEERHGIFNGSSGNGR